MRKRFEKKMKESSKSEGKEKQDYFETCRERNNVIVIVQY